MDEIEKANFDKMRNEHNAMSLKLEKSKLEILKAEADVLEKKVTIDRLSAELGRYKRKEKRKENN